MMNEALDVIIPLLEGRTVSAETDWFRLDNARLQHASFTRPRMEMAVTTIRSPAGALLAGRYGLGLLSLGGHSDEALEAYARNWGICEETAAAHGQVADRAGFRIAVHMHIADTRERAVEDVRHGIESWGGYARDVLPLGPVPKEVSDIHEFIVGSGRAIVGTPKDAIREIERMRSGTGGFGVIMFVCHDWADWDATRRSYELFARHVIPHFRGQLDARRASYDAAAARQPEFRAAALDGVNTAAANYEETREARQASGSDD